MLRRLLIALTLAAVTLPGSALARKDRTEPTPPQLKSVDVTEHPNAQVPGVLEFVDDTGKRVKLGDYFNQDKPIILTLNYYACPMLCVLTLNGMVDCLREVPLTPGQDYEIVTVSFNPDETSLISKPKKKNYVDYWGDGSAAHGWHFLTGEEQQIRTLTNTVGFSYNYIEATGEWAHPAVLMILTPDGRVSRYIYGVKFDEQTVKLSLVEASEGKIGSPLDKILLYCYHYDSSTGAYAPVAMNIMRLGGGITLLALGIVLSMFWAAEKRRANIKSGTGVPPVSATPGVSNV